MPTYLTHESSPVYTSNADYLDLDTLSLGKKPQLSETTNGGTHQIVLGKNSPNNPHDSFDESSLSSARASDVSESAPPHMNETRPTSMSSLPNGKTINGGGHDGLNGVSYPLLSGSGKEELPPSGHVRMPDRTAPSPPVTNGLTASANGASPDSADWGQLRTSSGPHSVSSALHGSLEESQATKSGTEPAAQQDVDLPDAANTGLQQKPHDTGPSTPNPATASNISLSADQRNRAPPHRYSSPPLYQTTSASQATLSSLQIPPNSGLKHRHTLEVPKVQPGRSSKDGADSAFTSGRFSPTSATAGARRASLSLAKRNTRSLQSEGPRDDIVPDEDALRWAEAYRQKRASKRKKREEEDDDRVLVGTKVDEHHANWTTAYNMLTGIRVSVSRTNAKLDRPLTPEDFQAKQKSTFDM